MAKFKLLLALLVVHLLSGVSCQEVYEECSSIGCVHASAKLLSRIDNDTNPCDDFYQFSCGTFLRNTYTPDEKLTVNTESLISDQLDEHLFRILNKPVGDGEPRPHQKAKYFYKNCMNLERIKELENKQLLNLLEHLGGWPVLKQWSEKEWNWEKSLLLLHRFVGVGNRTNIFRGNVSDGVVEGDDVIDNALGGNGEDEELNDETQFNTYFEYMTEVAVVLGAPNSNATGGDLFDALELGIALNQLLDVKNFKSSSRLKPEEYRELQMELELLHWMEIFHPFQLRTVKSDLVNRKISVQDNLKRLKMTNKPRVFANYILWRIVDFSIQFHGDEIQEKVLKLYRQSYGVLDKEQRWKLCTRMTNRYAELASGSLYIRQHFPKEAREAAINLTKDIVGAFKRTIKASDWMDQETQKQALDVVNNLSIYMGYDEKLLDIQEVVKYYGESYRNFDDSFFFLGLQLNVHKADKAFKHKFRQEPDWTEYAKPTGSRARYSRNDNSIYFAAAFLQPPNFDKDRPTSMNYGAIGSIIAHELTHCFDRFTENKSFLKWGSASKNQYIDKLKCIVNQYSSFVDPELNSYLNGTVTRAEDTADNGGIKLAYKAYEEWLKTSQPTQSRLIALEYTPKQLFWISYAQFYCSVQREETKRRLLETFEVHSFDRFRVKGPLMNSQEFATDFNCPINSLMNPDRQRCAIW